MEKLLVASKENQIILSLGNPEDPHQMVFSLNPKPKRPRDESRETKVYLYNNISVSSLYQALSEIVGVLLQEEEGYVTLNTNGDPHSMDTVTITIPITEDMVGKVSDEIRDTYFVYGELMDVIEKRIDELGLTYDSEILDQIVHSMVEKAIDL